MCSLDRLIIWYYFRLIFFSDVGCLLGKEWALYVGKEGDSLGVPSPYPPCLEQLNSSLELQNVPSTKICSVPAVTRPAPGAGSPMGTALHPCPPEACILFHLANKILQLLLLGRQFVDCYHWYTSVESLGSIPSSFSKKTWYLSIAYHILPEKSMS